MGAIWSGTKLPTTTTPPHPIDASQGVPLPATVQEMSKKLQHTDATAVVSSLFVLPHIQQTIRHSSGRSSSSPSPSPSNSSARSSPPPRNSSGRSSPSPRNSRRRSSSRSSRNNSQVHNHTIISHTIRSIQTPSAASFPCCRRTCGGARAGAGCSATTARYTST